MDTKWENLVTLGQDKDTVDLVFTLRKGGAFTFNIGVVMDNGSSSSGLLRIQAEEPSIQVLTDNGSLVDFGTLAEDCFTSVPLVLVNCGHGNAPIYLEIRQPNDLFSFENCTKDLKFDIPGLRSISTPVD